MDSRRPVLFLVLGSKLRRRGLELIRWYRSLTSLVMFVMMMSPFFLINRVPAAVALSIPVVAIMTVFPLRLSSVEQRLRLLEQDVTSLRGSLSFQDETLRQVKIDLTALQYFVKEQRADFEGRLSDSEQRELERQQALLQFQQSILALVNESLVRIESLAVAERLRFEAQLRSAESSLTA